MQKDKQMDIIADYYMALGKYSPNEKYSESNVRVYTSPESDCWLVLERKGENAIQARMTDETGKIISWDNYEVMNVAVKQIEAIRVSVSGRSEILFTPAELRVIERYGDLDRNTTRGKLDILLERFKDDGTKKSAQAVIDKLGRISDKSYADLYSVRQRKMENEKEFSMENRFKVAREKAEKHNAEVKNLVVERRKGKGNRAMKLTRYEQETIINFNAGEQTATLYTRDPAIMRKVDALVIEYPDTYKCIGETDIDKTYEMPKSFVSYRKPRRLSEEQKNLARSRMVKINETKSDV